jgi:cytochrome c6
MDVKIIFVSALVGLTSSCSNSVESYSESSQDQEPPDGELLFLNNCASCHGVDGKLGVSSAKDLTQTKLDTAGIYKVVVEGKKVMPPFGFILTTEEERNAVVNHAISLKD